ncbi:MAG: helix-turn-helix transcriptional regulator [Acinetobacter populi]|nr:helix-turn-helix transcriptional regulator [Acinetobacter populi]MCH4246705.1 helix-turn-helix transcriptional regulator [Acinetobacter populi]
MNQTSSIEHARLGTLNSTSLDMSHLHLDAYQYQAKEEVYPHSNLWGDFNFSLDGILEFNIDQQVYLSPPTFGLWIPPHTPHQAISRYDQETRFICFRISPTLSRHLAATPSVIQISPLISFITQHLLDQRTQQTPLQQWHKLLVLFDELSTAPSHEHYLPLSNDIALKKITDFLLQPQHHALKLHSICTHFAMSERHLLRLFQQHFAMSISEWRNRAKLIYAIDQLKLNVSIKKIALDLNYHHPSAFIEFFKRYTNMTPEQFRLHQLSA